MIPRRKLEIFLDVQKIVLLEQGEIIFTADISTAKKGPGEINGSECTPRGEHEICQKFGAGCEPDTVFVARQPTGEIYSPELAASEKERDWILTRILWLSGLEEGKNKGDNVDTRDRYIYIHGAPDDAVTAAPDSHGCIRMNNKDIIELFELVETGLQVSIYETSNKASGKINN